MHTIDEVRQRVREHFGVGINLNIKMVVLFLVLSESGNLRHHQADFKEIRRHSHQNVYLAEKVIVERRHPVIVCNAREEVHQDKLTIALPAISRFFLSSGLGLRAALDDDDSWRSTSSNGY